MSFQSITKLKYYNTNLSHRSRFKVHFFSIGKPYPDVDVVSFSIFSDFCAFLLTTSSLSILSRVWIFFCCTFFFTLGEGTDNGGAWNTIIIPTKHFNSSEFVITRNPIWKITFARNQMCLRVWNFSVNSKC